MPRLSVLHVVIIAAATAAGMQAIQGIGPASAANPKPTIGKKGKTVGPSGEPDSPKPFQFPRGKQSFYVRTRSNNAVSGATTSPSAKCDDEDDIAFSSSCYSIDLGQQTSERMVDWTTNERPAEVQCRFYNTTGKTIKVEAHIFCLRYDAEE